MDTAKTAGDPRMRQLSPAGRLPILTRPGITPRHFGTGLTRPATPGRAPYPYRGRDTEPDPREFTARTRLVRDDAYDDTGHSFAVFSADRTYRYLLVRRWGDGPLLTWIMLNPSKADAFKNDPTAARCIGFTRGYGYDGMQILNLFGLKATDPRELLTHPDPAGLYNDRFITLYAGGAVVAAWGTHGQYRHRDLQVAERLAEAGIALVCLGVTKDGHPKHPLARGRERVPDGAPLTPWPPLTPAPPLPPPRGGAGLTVPAAGKNATATVGKPAPSRPAAGVNPPGAS